MIYLDHNATTPPLPEVIEATAHAMRALPANPSSVHRMGQAARNALDDARAQVASLIHASPRDLVLLSGATEANQLALRGALGAMRLKDPQKPLTLLTSAAEHPSVVGAAAACVEHLGARWVRLPLDGLARLDLAALADALRAQPAPTLLSVMLAQNEVGNLYPIQEIAALARAAAPGVIIHCDATQAVGRVPVDARALGVDLLSFSAHKMGGPRGAGALYVRDRLPLDALMRGGHQERGLRAGTEDLPALIGFGVAASLAQTRSLLLWPDVQRRAVRLWDTLRAALPDLHWLGDRERSVGNTCCVAFDGAPADELLMALDMAGVAASAGSACSSGSLEPSPVLLAAGVDPDRARCAVRFSLGLSTSDDDITRAARVIIDQVNLVRGVHR